MINFEELHHSVQNILTGVDASLCVDTYCAKIGQGENASLKGFILSALQNVCYGDVALGEAAYNIAVLLPRMDNRLDFASELLSVALGEEALSVITKYKINKDSWDEAQREVLMEKELHPERFVGSLAPENATPEEKREKNRSEILIPKKEAREDNRTLYTRLFDALEPFHLHVDEQAVIATEVEKYIQGETTAKDVNAYIAAHLDKPISEVGKIIESLNTHIFVPLKKTLAEEKVLDIHDSDDALTEALLGKRAKKSGPLSFIPSDLERSIEKRKKEEIMEDLRSSGGTPGGASLLSKEVKDEQEEQKIEEKMNISIMPKKRYTVDPYRETI